MKQLNELENFMSLFAPESGSCKGISSVDAFKACELGAILLDIRDEDFTLYKQFAVPELLYLPLNNAQDKIIENLPKDRWIIVADAAGNLSRDFSLKLLKAGYSKITILSGGIVDWERIGLPISKDSKQEMSGSCVCQLKKN